MNKAFGQPSVNVLVYNVVILCFYTLRNDDQDTPTPVFLPGESRGWRSLVGCRLWGRTELDTTEATRQQQQQQGSVTCGEHQIVNAYRE